MINYLVFDFFFHFQKKYIPTPDSAYIPMNIYIGFTLSPKSHAISRLVAVLNYLFLLIYANTTSTAKMMMTIMCIGMPNKSYQLEMISLPIRFSINYQVKQVNHEVAKKHHRKSTYNNPNVNIKIFIPYIYLVNHLFRKKNLTLISIQIAVKIYSSKSLNGALMGIGK